MVKGVLRALLIYHVVARAMNAGDVIPPLVSLIFFLQLHPKAFLTQVFVHDFFTVYFSVGGLYRTVLATTITVLRCVSLVTVDTLPENKVGREVDIVICKLLFDLSKVFKEIERAIT